MAEGGEAAELRSLDQNTSFINAVVNGGNLQWFSDKLIEKGIITRRKARSIINMTGVTVDKQVGLLIDDVYGAIEISDNKGEKYDSFVDIFSHDAAYSDLAKKLRSSVASTEKSKSEPTVISPTDTETSEDETLDLQDVITELKPLTASWRPVGLALRLNNDDLKKIDRQNRELDDCLRAMVELWLALKYKHERYGVPSWEMLAKAVESDAGGANPALAIKIRKNHQGGK